MKKLIEFIFSGCWHHWEEWDRKGVADDNGVVIGFATFNRCAKCGSHKRFNLY